MNKREVSPKHITYLLTCISSDEGIYLPSPLLYKYGLIFSLIAASNSVKSLVFLALRVKAANSPIHIILLCNN